MVGGALHLNGAWYIVICQGDCFVRPLLGVAPKPSYCINALAAFSFDTRGAKEKAIKKKSAERSISRSAEREKGYAPFTAPLPKKAGENFHHTDENPS